MKQIDYLKLVATGRKSIHYARPSDADDALTGFAGICFIVSLLLVFGIATFASYLGEPMNVEMLRWPLAATVLPGIGYFVCGLFIGDAPRLSRYGMLLVGATVVIALSLLAVTPWYLFVPPFLYSLLVSIAAVRQL